MSNLTCLNSNAAISSDTRRFWQYVETFISRGAKFPKDGRNSSSFDRSIDRVIYLRKGEIGEVFKNITQWRERFETSNTGKGVSGKHTALSHRWPVVKQHPRPLNWHVVTDTERIPRNSCLTGIERTGEIIRQIRGEITGGGEADISPLSMLYSSYYK